MACFLSSLKGGGEEAVNSKQCLAMVGSGFEQFLLTVGEMWTLAMPLADIKESFLILLSMIMILLVIFLKTLSVEDSN
jgi:hypothetical protein